MLSRCFNYGSRAAAISLPEIIFCLKLTPPSGWFFFFGDFPRFERRIVETAPRYEIGKTAGVVEAKTDFRRKPRQRHYNNYKDFETGVNFFFLRGSHINHVVDQIKRILLMAYSNIVSTKNIIISQVAHLFYICLRLLFLSTFVHCALSVQNACKVSHE